MLSKDPVTSVADVKRIKPWIPDGDPIAVELLKAFGISPIPLSILDVLPALQTGIIDAVAVPPVVALALQWHNHVEYMLDIPLIYVYSLLALDKKSFASISLQDQDLVRELLDGVFKNVDGGNRTDNEKARKALISQGIKVISPSEEDRADWESVAKKSIDDLVASGEITAEVVSTFNQHLDRYRQNIAPGSE